MKKKHLGFNKKCVHVCLKVQPNTVIYELTAYSISNWLLHFVTNDKRAGHTLSPLNELNLPHKNTRPHSHTFTYSRHTHMHTKARPYINCGHTRASAKRKPRRRPSPQPINTRSHTLLTHYPELSYPRVTIYWQALAPTSLWHVPPGSKASSVVWRAGECWGPCGAVGVGWGGGADQGERSYSFGSLWSKGPGELKGGTLLKNTCDNDVIWVLARPARQLLTVMM